jgi:hypothetical protein
MFSKANPPTGNLSSNRTHCTLRTTNLSDNPLLLRPAESGLINITHDHSTVISLRTCKQAGPPLGRQAP